MSQEDFEECFRRDYPVVARATMLIVGDADLAREIAQESFTRLYERWDGVASLDHARNLAFKIALNLARSHLRRSRRVIPELLRSARSPLAVTADESSAVTDRLVIRQAMSELSPRQRACLVLVDYAGFDAATTARILRIRPSTVHVHISRGRRLLRSKLEGIRHVGEEE